MKKINLKNRLFIMSVMIIVIFSTCAFPCYTISNYNNNFRVKRSEEYQSRTDSNTGNIDAIVMDIYQTQKPAIFHSALEDIWLFILSNKLIMILLLSVVLAFNNLYRFIKRRNILISQTNIKLFLVHYLQLKDGKKGALSVMYSF